jgi:hypothetical protein
VGKEKGQEQSLTLSVDIMLKTVFVPKNSGTVLKQELKEKLIYLIAYATTRNERIVLKVLHDDDSSSRLTFVYF